MTINENGKIILGNNLKSNSILEILAKEGNISGILFKRGAIGH